MAAKKIGLFRSNFRIFGVFITIPPLVNYDLGTRGGIVIRNRTDLKGVAANVANAARLGLPV